jgi:glycine/D-amino acid oxidase-like deaminating enzyme
LYAEVASIEPGRTITSLGTIESPVIIVAAGIGSNKFFSGLNLRPRKGHLAITPRGFRVSSRQVVELGYLRSAHGTLEDSVAFNLQPRATDQTLIGSSRQFGKEDRQIDCNILAKMLQRAVRFVPSLADIPILRAWTGFRPTTSTGYPLIGPIDDTPGILLATGHEGLGIATAPATAKLIAHHLGWSRCPLDPKPFLPVGVGLV